MIDREDGESKLEQSRKPHPRAPQVVMLDGDRVKWSRGEVRIMTPLMTDKLSFMKSLGREQRIAQ
jgi:hypothetical protein